MASARVSAGSERLDETTLSYFKRVESVFSKQSFENEDDRKTFLDNVIRQMEGIETRIACNQQLSHVLETIIDSTSPDDVYQLHLMLLTNWQELVCHKSGCHVIESCIARVPELMTSEGGAEIKRVFCDMCRSILCDLTRMLNDTYGSHVLRKIIETLAGYRVNSKPLNKQDWQSNKRLVRLEGTRPKRFSKLLRKYGKHVVNRDDFIVLPTHPSASPVIQTLLELLVFTEPETGRFLCQAVLQAIGVESSEPVECDLMFHPIGSHLIEVLLLVLCDDDFQLLYSAAFRGKLASISNHPIANHTVQSLIEHARNTAQLGMIADELLPCFETVLMAGHVGVLVRLVEALGKMKLRQKECLKSLLSAFHVLDNAVLCVYLFMTLQTLESILPHIESTSSEEKAGYLKHHIHVSGSLLVQALVQFEDTKTLVSSFLTLSTAEMIVLCCHPSGSRAVESFMKSKTVQPKKKNKLVANLQGHMSTLACDKWGSHVIDACWTNTEISTKKQITNELVANESQLRGSFSGKIVWRNCRLDYAKEKGLRWQQKVAADDRKRKMFDDFVNDGSKKGPQTKQATDASSIVNSKYKKEMKQLGFMDDLISTNAELEERSSTEVDNPGIDDILNPIFKQSRKRKRNQLDKKESRDTATSTADRHSKGMQFIVDAITATKRKKQDATTTKTKRKDRRQFVR
ncbi:nucleolar protein 9-like [Corticium candelabrum]|uniref:nucleolar protein 9-like n=1 Tax=Corticium candelabrum TaxID=121492 RepID=UPI002E2749F0|nr:nucleolar protein 9-like [Corticium candelabrum]